MHVPSTWIFIQMHLGKWMTSGFTMFLNKCSCTVLNLAAVMAHSSGYRITAQQYSSSISACASEGGKVMDLGVSVLLQSYFKQFAVSAWQPRHSSSPTAAGVLGFISIFSTFILCAQHSDQLSGGSENHYSSILGKEKKFYRLWCRTKTFGTAITQPSLNTQFPNFTGSGVDGHFSRFIQQPECMEQM